MKKSFITLGLYLCCSQILNTGSLALRRYKISCFYPRAEDKDRPEEKKDEEKTDQENRERKVEADEKDRRKEEPERQKEEDREKKETDESRDRSR